MKLLIALASMLMLSSLAVAVPDSSQLGPYAVSFDLNTDIQYEVQNAQPIENELATVYQMRMFTDNSTSAGITVIENKDLSDATLIMHKNLMAMEMTLRGLNVTSVDDMTIDGKAGFMATSVPIPTEQAVPADTKIYRGMYWLDSKECSECGPVSAGKTYVVISSSYPQDVTENLISSLHVEKGQAAPKAGSPDMPPATN
jgi:hypothetical protein